MEIYSKYRHIINGVLGAAALGALFVIGSGIKNDRKAVSKEEVKFILPHEVVEKTMPKPIPKPVPIVITEEEPKVVEKPVVIDSVETPKEVEIEVLPVEDVELIEDVYVDTTFIPDTLISFDSTKVDTIK